MATITFKPKQVTKRLLSTLQERARNVLVKRYGLETNGDQLTLEAIGSLYGITRERVRQIENTALQHVRKSAAYKAEKAIFEELENIVKTLGGIVAEEDLLEHISKDPLVQNHINFLLVIGDTFRRQKEDEHFKHRWYVDFETSKKVHEALKHLYDNLSDDDLMTESDLIKEFLKHLEEVAEHYKNEAILKRWLSLSKKVGKNPLGEWGKSQSPNVKTKGIRDYAFLAMRRHGSPIHFKDIAKAIEQLFKTKAHVATTHNELIKDKRFVLVGRGLYALAEWGYLSGVVKDVIKKVLDKHGPLTKEQIIDKVLKERYVKENTIVVNLQNSKFFKKQKDGTYMIASAK